jgi:Zn-dependent protease
MSFTSKYLTLSPIEKIDLLKAWVAISVAFAIVNTGSLSLDTVFLFALVMSALTVGIGFLVHEMSHRFLARKYGCWAEFRSNDQMLLLALVCSFFGFLFAAPGAVMIHGNITEEKNGKISAAGPASNIVIALIFMLIALFVPIPIIQMVAIYGMTINSWLALFNLIPFGFFDGIKVLRWNKLFYVILAAAAVFLVFFSGIVAENVKNIYLV